MQNLIYALIQIIHNFGAVTVVGTATAAIWLTHGNAGVRHRMSYLMALAWTVQAASGVMFGATTYYFEKHLPDIHGVAVGALVVKITCAAGSWRNCAGLCRLFALVFLKFHYSSLFKTVNRIVKPLIGSANMVKTDPV